VPDPYGWVVAIAAGWGYGSPNLIAELTSK
jgi:hypothetical protein